METFDVLSIRGIKEYKIEITRLFDLNPSKD